MSGIPNVVRQRTTRSGDGQHMSSPGFPSDGVPAPPSTPLDNTRRSQRHSAFTPDSPVAPTARWERSQSVDHPEPTERSRGIGNQRCFRLDDRDGYRGGALMCRGSRRAVLPTPRGRKSEMTPNGAALSAHRSGTRRAPRHVSASPEGSNGHPAGLLRRGDSETAGLADRPPRGVPCGFRRGRPRTLWDRHPRSGRSRREPCERFHRTSHREGRAHELLRRPDPVLTPKATSHPARARRDRRAFW
ncbi:hypothetical protein SAMN04487905_107135 [Actinopolyspora xinjiangensis]|uniref:Uncharacterized protein n=1 Tax=Actinopolyspora xinjiangensis TaxID=405564 RepID=A0A1H0UTJ2_9ACTN|nr:hypothetical protein SAMN04487905_107135 [Actinopolyspora xinjiangensis]